MGYVLRKVQVFNKSGSTWESSGTIITESFGEEAKVGIGKIKDSFVFRVPFGKSFFDLSNNPLITESLVKLWIWRDALNETDADLQIEGTIRSVDQSIDGNGDILIVKGDSFTEVFFDTEIPLNEQDKNWTEIAQAILQILRRTTDKQIFWASAANGYTGTPNPTVKQDGSAFPRETLILNYTKSSEMIEKITSNEFTGDGQYIYWLEKEGEKFFLVARAKGSTTAGTITEGEGFQIKISKDKDDVKNFVIYNCGDDLFGNPVEDVYYDTTSIGRIGYKTYYATEETQDLFVNFWNTERWSNENNASFNPDVDSKPQDDFPTAYPYTFIDGTVVSTDKAFNDYIESVALTQGRLVANSIVDLSAAPRYTIVHNDRFTNNFFRGELWQCVFPSRGLNKPLRIEQISQSVTETSLELKEDETTADFDS